MSTRRRTREKQRPPPRKKACRNCTKSKVRCDLERPACSRCRSGGRHCEYATSSTGSNAPDVELGREVEGIESSWTLPSLPRSTPLDPGLGLSIATTAPYALSPHQTHGHDSNRQTEPELDFAHVDLIPSSTAEDIRDRWLRPYILPPLGRDEIPKLYHPFTLQYISRVLSTYPHCMLRDGDVPPIIHRAQISGKMPRALANCYTLVRMWIQAVPGSESMVLSTVEREMERLSAETSNHDIDHLTTFQAYLIYTILLYFSPRSSNTNPVTDKTMITLMELASRTARHGLLSASELTHTRPTWESWIVASTKRRAVFAMYLFTSVYNADRCLPNFLADELRGVYVPEGKALWEARDREAWGREYERHLQWWGDGMLEIQELWRSAETGTPGRRDRVERWVRTVDEFGMMVFAVCVHVHGC